MQNPIKYLALTGAFLLACGGQTSDKEIIIDQTENQEPSEQWKKYWYSGLAEISSYEISQARYGELRKGEAVLVFVTEPFSYESMTKADRSRESNKSVLKCNFTKRFNTGIYPYTLMTSTFTPIQRPMMSPKITHGMQEWCGQVFMEYQRPAENLEIKSYFEGENANFSLKNARFENDLWGSLRINPESIPTGKQELVPDFAFLRFRHLDPEPMACEISIEKKDELILTLDYSDIRRKLTIKADKDFPHTIQSWEESYNSGFGSSEVLVSSGKRMKTIRVDYWNRNRNSDEYLRDSLQLRY